MKAAVLISGKPNNFIAGADISELAKCKSEEDAFNLVQNGQRVMDRLANMKRPVVAAINGSCLGGGLEVAMACQYRIASSGPKTALGLPEVKIGLLPGAGGTQRLPKLVGAQQGIKMCLTGSNLKADKAKKAGLVDQVADPHALFDAALQAAKELGDGTRKVRLKLQSSVFSFLSPLPVASSDAICWKDKSQENTVSNEYAGE